MISAAGCTSAEFMKCFISPFINSGTGGFLIYGFLAGDHSVADLLLFFIHSLLLFFKWGHSTCFGPPAEDELMCLLSGG